MSSGGKKTKCKMKVDSKKLSKHKAKMSLLKHISKKNCAMLPFLSDESLHTLGEFIFNVILQRVELSPKQAKKVRKILKKDKDFYVKLISEKNKKTYHVLSSEIDVRAPSWQWNRFVSSNFSTTDCFTFFAQVKRNVHHSPHCCTALL